MITVFCKDIKGKLRRIEVDADISIVNDQKAVKELLAKDATIYASSVVLALMNGTQRPVDNTPMLA